MIHRLYFDPSTNFVIKQWVFLKPAQLRIGNRADDTTKFVGFGIGDKIQTIQPGTIKLVASNELLGEIPLADGSFVVGYPDDLHITSDGFLGEATPEQAETARECHKQERCYRPHQQRRGNADANNTL